MDSGRKIEKRKGMSRMRESHTRKGKGKKILEEFRDRVKVSKGTVDHVFTGSNCGANPDGSWWYIRTEGKDSLPKYVKEL